jgi:hypothetical protein
VPNKIAAEPPVKFKVASRMTPSSVKTLLGKSSPNRASILESREIPVALTGLKNGDFAVRLPIDTEQLRSVLRCGLYQKIH